MYLSHHNWIFLTIIWITVAGQSQHRTTKAPGYHEHQPISSIKGQRRSACQWENYAAACGEDEVIVMTAAKYGRMELGRCLDQDFGYMGCGTNVLPQLDAHCSGKQACEFPVTTLHQENDCPKGLTGYLDAEHICLQVTPCQRALCDDSDYLKLSSPTGYLASSLTSSEKCGSPDCPWMLTADIGQRFNLTLIDFTHAAESSTSSSGHDLCNRYATIHEDSVSKDVTSCNQDLSLPRRRTRHLYLSSTNNVQVQLYTFPESSPSDKTSDGFNPSPRFLIKYEVVGCPPVPAPPHSRIEHGPSPDTATVSCTNSDLIWHLVCSGHKWVGEVGQCEGSPSIGQVGEIVDTSQPYGLLLVIGLGVALGVVIGSVLLLFALLCMKRNKRRTSEHLSGPHSLLHDSPSRGDPFSNKLSDTYYPASPRHMQVQDHNYTSTLHLMRPLPPHCYPGDNLPLPPPPETFQHGIREHVYETPQLDGLPTTPEHKLIMEPNSGSGSVGGMGGGRPL